jgi:hypothetical protein
MKKYFILLLAIGTVVLLNAQDKNKPTFNKITKGDSVYFALMPKLRLSDISSVSMAKSLPYAVDNSTQPYFRPVFSQSSLDCGQASSVAICFASEINFVRGLNGTVSANQYPTFFTYNFQNQGTGWSGVSYFHSFEILKACGTPNSDVYGGMYNGDDSVWMSGYDKYYHAMQNRLIEAYTIEANTPEGLEVLKRWLNDHGDGSSGGGYAVFYAQCCGASATLPAGTEEAGKFCHPTWGASANHAMTIVGYNDSIRFDFNGDGQYTNHIDINVDGIVDMRDWEIGGLKYANTYAGGPSWGNGGFCYMFYKALADDINNGGIWNHSVQVVKPQADCQPLLTMKATITHNKRVRLKISAGYSTNTSATSPDYVMDFPVFNFQGGNFFMQGGYTIEANKTLELGLDITPFLNTLDPAQNVKYFLIVDEVDGDGSGIGEVVNFSVISYTSGFNETVCSSTNVPIVNNGQTLLSVVKNVNFTPITITTNVIPDITVYEDFSFQMEAANGNAPYAWDIIIDYNKTEITESFPTTGSSTGTFSSGHFYIDLPFEFAYYDQYFSKLAVLDDGTILLQEDLLPWPYYLETRELMFHKYKMIAPMYSENISFYGSQGDNITYTMNSDSITIVFNASKSSDYTDVKFAVRILKSGDIKFFYNTLASGLNLAEMIGLSEGDHFNHLLFEESTNDISGKTFLLQYPDYPKGMFITTTGMFYGVVDQPYLNSPINFKAQDENGLITRKTLFITTDGIIIDYEANAGANGIIDFGESITLDMSIFNTYVDPINACTMTLSSGSPFITITDNFENIGTLPGLFESVFPNAFGIDISDQIPDNQVIPLTCTVNSGINSWTRNFSIIARAPIIEVLDYFVDDGGDNLLDPGETADIYITYINNGGSRADNINLDFSTLDLNLIINSTPTNPAIAFLEPEGTETIVINVTVANDSPTGHIVQINCDVTADNNYSATDIFYVGIGLIIEDFETGDLEEFSWHTIGSADWFVTDELPYEGAYCVKSGDIGDNQQSSLKIIVEVLQSGTISFFKKVSCEDGPSENYDYLAFLIDDVQIGIWDGEIPWSESSYPVSPGVHVFEWVYVKDYSVSSGGDAAWVDYITFPPILNTSPIFVVNPDSITKMMPPDALDSDTISLANIGGGFVDYNIVINYAAVSGGSKSTKSIEGSYIDCPTNFFNTGEPFSINVTVYNTSIDDEWLEDVYIYFPPGVYLDSCTNFVGGGGGPMIHNGVTGDNDTVQWHGEDASGWGVVHGGQSATATLYLNIDPAITSEVVFEYTLVGDIYGADPHTIDSSFSITNYGEVQDWITVDHYDGTVIMSETNDLVINYDTYGLGFWDILLRNLYSKHF